MSDSEQKIVDTAKIEFVKLCKESIVYVGTGSVMVREYAEKHRITETAARKLIDRAVADMLAEINSHFAHLYLRWPN